MPTDMELAQLLLSRITLRRQGETIFLFNGQFYVRLTDEQFRTEILRNLRDELSVAGSSKQLRTVAAAILAEPEIEVGTVPQTEGKLCLKNGVLDLHTLRLESFTPAYFLTCQLQAEWLGEQACPVFQRFLMTITGGDAILVQRFIEVLGYLLICPDNRAKRFVLMQGRGDTGKSVLGRLIQAFFNADQVGSVDIFKLGDRFALSGLIGKRVNISMDLTDASLNEQAASVVKQITGGDLLQIEEKYKAPYALQVPCKLVFGSNHVLRLNAIDPALVRRLLLLPFQYPIPIAQQDSQLSRKLEQERSGILYYAVAAYQQLEARNYVFAGDDCCFPPCSQLGDAVSKSKEECVEQFVTACIGADPGGFLPIEQIFDYYQKWCTIHGDQIIENKQVFSTKLRPHLQERFGAQKTKKRVHGEPTNGYTDICLTEKKCV